MGGVDRRRFPRLNLPMVYRRAGLLGPRQRARDISRGGMRVLTDDDLTIGMRLTIEIFLPTDESIRVDVRVAWIRELLGEDARFEAGLEFLAADPLRRAQLEECLDRYENP
jgi:c-di-GMP-binding flagellar brake protein YcgR